MRSLLAFFLLPLSLMAAEPPHKNEGLFVNPYVKKPAQSFTRFISWQLSRKDIVPSKEEISKIPLQLVSLSKIEKPGPEPQVTWMGHSTILVQVKGKNILTDPIFSDFASPLPGKTKRITPPAMTLQELPKIDFVVISHNHYDHLDYETVKALGNTPIWFVPLGLKAWFAECNITNVIEMDWWEEKKVGDLTFVCTPSQHWSGRTLFDRFETLWCSWVIKSADFSFFFAGDTGYNDKQFKEIGARLGPFEAAAIPIGGYAPRWFMNTHHVNPREAVKIHRDLHSKWSFAIHWGTFILSDEPVLEPPIKLKQALLQFEIPKSRFEVLKIGETRLIN